MQKVQFEGSAVAMWDFTWLTRRFGAEAEYADFDRVLDELRERGYDSRRVDPFPHYLSHLEDDPSRQDEFTVSCRGRQGPFGKSSATSTARFPS
jgi:hypothetical protein